MEVPFLDLKINNSHLRDEIKSQIIHLIDNATFIGGGPVQEFEEKFSSFCGGGHCVSVANGTDALILALRAFGVGPGDEVITVPFTFIATAEAIGVVGATPKFVDIDPKTYTMDVNLLDKALGPKTKAIIPVHLYGQPADMDPIMDIARKRGIHVIEDAAQAHGAEYKGKRVGLIGDIGCFSFYPTKNLGGFGDAGAVTTLSSKWAEIIRKIANHGRSQTYFHDIEGINSRLDSLQAAVLVLKLKTLNEANQRRRDIAVKYNRAINSNSFIDAPGIAKYSNHVFHLYCVESSFREVLMRTLKQKGIGHGVYYPVPLHMQPAYSHLNYKKGSFPISERASERILSLPMGPHLTDEQVSFVCQTIEQFNPRQ